MLRLRAERPSAAKGDRLFLPPRGIGLPQRPRGAARRGAQLPPDRRDRCACCRRSMSFDRVAHRVMHRAGNAFQQDGGLGGAAALAVQHQGDGDQPGMAQGAAALGQPLAFRHQHTAVAMDAARRALRRSVRRGPAPAATIGHWPAPAPAGTCSDLARRACSVMWRSSPCTGMAMRGPGPAIHLFQLVAAGMAGDMDEMILLGQHLHAQRRQLVLQLEDRQFVAGNDAGGKNHRIALAQMHKGMVVVGDAGQRRARLALAAGAQIENLVGGQIGGFGGVDGGGKSFR